MIIVACVVGTVLVACKPQTPSRFIQPGDLEDILVDYHMAMAMAEEKFDDQLSIRREVYMESVLKKHGVSRADFDSSMVFYYTHAERFAKIYSRVSARLEEKALSLGATEGEIGKYASLTSDGDTANVWNDRRTMMMRPMPPYNRFDFEIESDSTYRRGDSFLLQFMTDYVFQDGSKDAMLYVAVDYPDTVVTRQLRFSYMGLCQLRIDPGVKSDVQRLRGFFYLGGANEQSTTQRLLFIHSIQLIRFHSKDEPEKTEPEKTETGSVAPSDDAQRKLSADDSRRDTLGRGVKMLPLGGRDIPNRMVTRRDSLIR